MNSFKFLVTFLSLGMSLILFSQESKRAETTNSVIEFINSYTKGFTFIVTDSGINSELNEIGSTFFRNKYIILSNKKRKIPQANSKEVTKEPYNNLYRVEIKENGDLSFPLLFSQTLDSEKDDGSMGFTPDQKTVYFTRENEENKETHTLYKASLNEKNPNKWVNLIDLKIVPKNYSIETPNLSSDGKTIYVASNIPGGYGGFDIYEAEILANGSIGELINLGPNVNTSADEKYPFSYSNSNYLYFSSKGHANVGGYDVFRSSNVKGRFTLTVNMGTTLNSKEDDIAFVMASPTRGYISTNRKQKNDFDILKFEIEKEANLVQNYTVLKENSKDVLPNVVVIIKNEFGRMVAALKTDVKGRINFKVEPLAIYTVGIKTPGYEEFSAQISLSDVNKNFILKKTNN